MRYLSVCSGIEAASVAWHPLGWTPVGFSEIEPFPSAVLKHRFPNVPNYGDMTKYKEWPIEPGTVNVLVGGTPCQSFSVAGLRKGLSDPRGGLMLTYLEIAQRLRPRWIVWENVPGVLSSNGGRDFGSFLGALGELGYGWAYRVLDAQWVRTQWHPRAVPQRRRRVFVVGCLGDGAAAAKVLFESESVRRDSAPRRTAREETPDDAARCFAGSSESGVAAALETTCHDYSRADGFNTVVQPAWPADVSPTLNQSARGTGAPGYSDQEIFSQGAGHLVPQPVPFTKAKRVQSTTDDETWVDGTVNPTLSLFDRGETRATTVAVAFTVDMQACKGNANVGDGSVSPTLCKPSGNDVHAVAFQQNQVGEVRTSAVAGTVNTNSNPSGRNTPMVALGTDCYNGAMTGDVAATMGTPGSSVNASGPTVMQEVAQAFTVRRLSCKECERLQAFPDDWTLIPWRGKSAEDCPDGPRYKALGNSMAVNVMAWIGERINTYENTHGIRTAE
jgi:DNA (cytosine-5)-methyltransferase 1